MLDAAAARGYPIKVVLFANEEDTGGEPEPLEDTQTYVTTDQRRARRHQPAPGAGADRHAAPVRHRREPAARRHADARSRRPLAAELARGLPLAEQAEGNALARTAMVAVRRLAADGGHPLPTRIPPAEQNLDGILGAAAADDAGTLERPWLIAAVVAGTALLLVALLVVVHRRAARGHEQVT